MKKPKFKIGDSVWVLEDGKVIKKTITGVVLVDGGKEVGYCTEVLKEKWYTHFYPHEPKLFLSKEELIKSL